MDAVIFPSFLDNLSIEFTPNDQTDIGWPSGFQQDYWGRRYGSGEAGISFYQFNKERRRRRLIPSRTILCATV